MAALPVQRSDSCLLYTSETNDLLVPATAEIVLEGHVRPYERWDEGPFGEATGYRASPRMPRPVFRVDCITHRNSPIMPISCAGTDLDECEILYGVFSNTSAAKRELAEAGLPVRDAYSAPGLKFSLLIVTVEKGHAGIADRVVSVIRSSKLGVRFAYIMVVEDDAVSYTHLDVYKRQKKTFVTCLMRSWPGFVRSKFFCMPPSMSTSHGSW